MRFQIYIVVLFFDSDLGDIQQVKLCVDDSDQKINQLVSILISEDESYLALDCQDFFVIKPTYHNLFSQNYDESYKSVGAIPYKANCSYSSENNEYINDYILKSMIEEMVEKKLV